MLAALKQELEDQRRFAAKVHEENTKLIKEQMAALARLQEERGPSPSAREMEMLRFMEEQDREERESERAASPRHHAWLGPSGQHPPHQHHHPHPHSQAHDPSHHPHHRPHHLDHHHHHHHHQQQKQQQQQQQEHRSRASPEAHRPYDPADRYPPASRGHSAHQGEHVHGSSHSHHLQPYASGHDASARSRPASPKSHSRATSPVRFRDAASPLHRNRDIELPKSAQDLLHSIGQERQREAAKRVQAGSLAPEVQGTLMSAAGLQPVPVWPGALRWEDVAEPSPKPRSGSVEPWLKAHFGGAVGPEVGAQRPHPQYAHAQPSQGPASRGPSPSPGLASRLPAVSDWHRSFDLKSPLRPEFVNRSPAPDTDADPSFLAPSVPEAPGVGSDSLQGRSAGPADRTAAPVGQALPEPSPHRAGFWPVRPPSRNDAPAPGYFYTAEPDNAVEKLFNSYTVSPARIRLPKFDNMLPGDGAFHRGLAERKKIREEALVRDFVNFLSDS